MIPIFVYPVIGLAFACVVYIGYRLLKFTIDLINNGGFLL